MKQRVALSTRAFESAIQFWPKIAGKLQVDEAVSACDVVNVLSASVMVNHSSAYNKT